ncbi:MAG: DUF6159 family protein [Microcystaceae cyanobacterium]
MARKVANGVELTKQCWQALQQNPQLMVFPLLSGISLVIVGFIMIIPLFAGGLFLNSGQTSLEGDPSTAEWIFGLIMVFIYYFMSYTVIIFSNTALVGVSLKLLKGESASVKDGILIAMSHLGQIIGFAIISATIGTIAKYITESGRNADNLIISLLASLLGGLIQGVWSVVIFFAIPVYIVENVGPIGAIRRSWDVFRETWGEGFTGRAMIGGVSCLVQFILLAILAALFVIGVSTLSIPLIIVAILFGIISFGAIALLTGAINGIFQASLYHYATTGDAGRFIDNDLARNAFPS